MDTEMVTGILLASLFFNAKGKYYQKASLLKSSPLQINLTDQSL